MTDTDERAREIAADYHLGRTLTKHLAPFIRDGQMNGRPEVQIARAAILATEERYKALVEAAYREGYAEAVGTCIHYEDEADMRWQNSAALANLNPGDNHD